MFDVVLGSKRKHTSQKRSHLSFADFNPPLAPHVIFIVSSLGRKHSKWPSQKPHTAVAWPFKEHYNIINNTTLIIFKNIKTIYYYTIGNIDSIVHNMNNTIYCMQQYSSKLDDVPCFFTLLIGNMQRLRLQDMRHTNELAEEKQDLRLAE